MKTAGSDLRYRGRNEPEAHKSVEYRGILAMQNP
jgi:hypothetical protein